MRGVEQMIVHRRRNNCHGTQWSYRFSTKSSRGVFGVLLRKLRFDLEKTSTFRKFDPVSNLKLIYFCLHSLSYVTFAIFSRILLVCMPDKICAWKRTRITVVENSKSLSTYNDPLITASKKLVFDERL